MVISIVNQKGGTGKTTTAINLGSSLVLLGKKVLLLGMDVQGDLSYSLNITDFDNSISEVLLGEVNINDVIIQREGMDIIPGDISLADVELNLLDFDNREFTLKDCLSGLTGEYDYIIVDCSPSLSLLTINALCASAARTFTPIWESNILTLKCPFR